MNPVKLLGPSWRTSATGLASVLIALGHVAEALAQGKPVQWELVMPTIVSGVGLMTARDNRVSSEAVGVAPFPVTTVSIHEVPTATEPLPRPTVAPKP